MKELADILKEQIKLLTEWNKEAISDSGCIEQVRMNCATISLLINHLTQLGC